jgi:hypothetical protein
MEKKLLRKIEMTRGADYYYIRIEIRNNHWNEKKEAWMRAAGSFG